MPSIWAATFIYESVFLDCGRKIGVAVNIRNVRITRRECIIADALHPEAQIQGRERAIIEGIIVDGGHIVGDGDSSQQIVPEGTVPDGFHIIGDGD